MFGIKDVLGVIKTINSYCLEIDNLDKANRETYRKEVERISKIEKDMRADMDDRFDEFCDEYFTPIRDRIDEVIELLKRDYPSEAEAIIGAREDYDDEDDASSGSTAALEASGGAATSYRGGSVYELRRKLYWYIDKLNAFINDLNRFNFDAHVPPITVRHPDAKEEKFDTSCVVRDRSGAARTIVKEYYYDDNKKHDRAVKQSKIADGKVLKKYAEAGYKLCSEALQCVDDLEKSYRLQFDFDGYDRFVANQKNMWLNETKAKLDSAYVDRFDSLFMNEDAKAIKRSFFTGLEKVGQDADVDPAVGSATYNHEINIGDLKLLVEKDPRHLQYISQSPTLSKYVQNGYLKCPLILDLQQQGNVLLNLSDDNYGDKVVAFVNQLIMQFLLSFPAKRINFCLVDIDNRLNFSQYKSLTKISSNILFNGIIRDDRQLENTIKDLEKTMFKIDEDFLSYNNVKDIYEYNAKYEANAQNVHLFVLVNYPSGMRDDLAKHVAKILQNGNKAGIFTVIINNPECPLQPGFKEEENDQFLATAEQCSVVINNEGGRFYLKSGAKNEFIPKQNIKASQLPAIIDMLKDMAESNRQKVIPLSQMFADTDALARKPKGIAPSEEILDIPIGARGGEIQSLLLKTTGDGAAHSVLIGGTGSGKSNLLHTIIMNACYKYSPEELNLYIVDFKGGVEFKYYEANKVRAKQIPHIKLIGLTSDLEDGVSILNNLHKEMRRREDEFRRCGVEDITQYRSAGKSIPRLFVIIDEIQELFEQDDRLGQKAIDILRELFKKGRAFGINILWASQNIPKAPGLKDKVLSQIGNRISLRLNEPDDALDIKIDPKVVKNLNRPEKGLGVINDIRYGNESVEFRVAYAENSENRQKYSDMIINKWKNVQGTYAKAPMYIVGDDDEPSPIAGDTIYNHVPTQNDIVSKAFEKYTLQLGQDYVTGQPFDMDIALRQDKENVVIAGYDVEIIRDMMGYSLMSVIMNHVTNADCVSPRVKLYYANGEMINPKNSKDLYNVLHTDFGELIDNVSTPAQMKDCVRDLYKLYKKRAEESYNSEYAKEYAPHFVLIHSLQRYAHLFTENPLLQLTEKKTEQAPSATSDGLDFANRLFASVNVPQAASDTSSSGIPDAIHFSDAFKEMLEGGGKLGVHFILSMDNPLGIQALARCMQEIKYKVFVKGIPSSIMAQMLGDYKSSSGLTNPRIALVAAQDEHTKIRVYRYSDELNRKWYETVRNNYKAIMKV